MDKLLGAAGLASSLLAIFRGKDIYVFALSLVGVAKPKHQTFLTQQSKIIARKRTMKAPFKKGRK